MLAIVPAAYSWNRKSRNEKKQQSKWYFSEAMVDLISKAML